MDTSGILFAIPILVYIAIILTIFYIIYRWVSKFISLKTEQNEILREIISKLEKE